MSSGHTLKRSNLLFFSPRLRCVLDLSFAVSTLEIVLNNRWKYGRHPLIGWSLHHLRPSYAQNQIGLLSSSLLTPTFPASADHIHINQEVLSPFHRWGRIVMNLPILCFKINSYFLCLHLGFFIYFISFLFFFFLPRITGCWRSQDAGHKRFIFCLPSEVVQNDQISLDFP